MKALITDGVHSVLIQELKAINITVDYRPMISDNQVRQAIPDYQILIVNSKIRVDKDMINRGKKLIVIGRLGSGMEIIDQVYAKEKGIAVVHSPSGNKDAVAEHAIGMLLTLLHRIRIADAEIRTRKWQREPNRGTELMRKVVGLIGYGHTGQAMAKKLRGFDVEILAYDKYKTDYSTPWISEATLKSIYQKADVLSIHLPLTKETRYMLNDAFFNAFEKPIYLLNTSRGQIVDTAALIRALEHKKILGAGLDVFENEKLDTFNATDEQWFSQLIAHPKVILTPHIAGWTHESKYKLARIIADKIIPLVKRPKD